MIALLIYNCGELERSKMVPAVHIEWVELSCLANLTTGAVMIGFVLFVFIIAISLFQISK